MAAGSMTRSFKDRIIFLLKDWPQLFILIFLVILMAIIAPNFATGANLMNILRQVSVISIISCGLTLVVVSGALDLSVGSALSLLTVVSAKMQLKSDLAGLLVPMGVAVLLGLLNGTIITSFKINSIIVTLGSLSLFAGLALLYTNGAIIIGIPDTWYSLFAQGEIAGIPLHVLMFIVIAAVYQFLLSKTKFGRGLIYLGTNRDAAKIAGIKTRLYQLIAFVISGLSVALAAVILSSRMNSGSPVAGVGVEFDAITAILIGGTSLDGGKGSIVKTVVGVLVLAVIINSLTLFNVPYAFQNIAKGLMILIAIIIDVKSREKYGK